MSYIKHNPFATTASEKVVENENNIIALDDALSNFEPKIDGSKIDISQNSSIVGIENEIDNTVMPSIATKEFITDHNKDIQSLESSKQNKLIAGSNITIIGDTISATGGSGSGTGGNVYLGDPKNAIKLNPNDYNIDESFNASIDTKGFDLSTNETIIGLDDKIDVNNDLIKQKVNIEDYDVDKKNVNEALDNTAKQVVENMDNIEAAEKNITKMTQDITSIQTDVQTNAQNISKNTTAIGLKADAFTTTEITFTMDDGAVFKGKFIN